MSRLSQTQAFDDIESNPEYSRQCEKLRPEEQELQDQAYRDQILEALLVKELF
jgi:hypothetical protein